ncbi:MAG: AAA family ATPase, partial [Thermomicrobiales bacterium]
MVTRTTTPTMLTTILGRDSEIDLVSGLLGQPGVRLVSLVGPGGVGKTRLAIAVIERLARDRDAPIHLVLLSSLRDASEVLPAIAVALDIRGNDAGILRQQVIARLQESPSVLVLDNMEHVRDAVPLVLDLLTQCPALAILTTTRIALRIAGERQIPLAPLPIPSLDHDRDVPDTPETLATIPSVALFLERAISTDPSFALRPDNRDDLAAICVALEGMPLAIELAAPWIRVMGPAALRQRLGNRLTLLAANASHVPARHRTLRETLHWSYQLLDVREQRVLRRCAILAGSWPLIAAEAVCAIDGTPDDPIGTDDLLHAIGTLIDHSLLFAADGAANAPRFRMLEIIREFGLEMLRTSCELPAVSQALAAWCVAYAETNAPHIFGPDQIRWLDTFGHERHTMRSGALAALERGDAVSALRISWHLGRFWLVRGHHLADHAWLERALAMDREPSGDPLAHAWGLMALGNSWFERGELLRASAGYWEASAYAADVGAAEVESGGQLNEAIVRLKLGDVPAAHTSAARSLAINRARGRRASVGKDLVILADIITTEGDPVSALTLLDEALAINEDLGDIRMVALTVNTLGIVAMAQGDLATARTHLRQSLG